MTAAGVGTVSVTAAGVWTVSATAAGMGTVSVTAADFLPVPSARKFRRMLRRSQNSPMPTSEAKLAKVSSNCRSLSVLLVCRQSRQGDGRCHR